MQIKRGGCSRRGSFRVIVIVIMAFFDVPKVLTNVDIRIRENRDSLSLLLG